MSRESGDVADRVKRLGLRLLAVEHGRDVALRREGAVEDRVGLRGLGDELRRYGIGYLTDDGVCCPRCFRGGCFSQSGRVPETFPKSSIEPHPSSPEWDASGFG